MPFRQLFLNSQLRRCHNSLLQCRRFNSLYRALKEMAECVIFSLPQAFSTLNIFELSAATVRAVF